MHNQSALTRELVGRLVGHDSDEPTRAVEHLGLAVLLGGEGRLEVQSFRGGDDDQHSSGLSDVIAVRPLGAHVNHDLEDEDVGMPRHAGAAPVGRSRKRSERPFTGA